MLKNLFDCRCRLENLAWATAQIHCYSTMAEEDKSSEAVLRKNSTYSHSSMYSAETALNASQADGEVVLSTEPKILFCDLGLLPGDTKSCKYFLFLSRCVLHAKLSLIFRCASKTCSRKRFRCPAHRRIAARASATSTKSPLPHRRSARRCKYCGCQFACYRCRRPSGRTRYPPCATRPATNCHPPIRFSRAANRPKPNWRSHYTICRIPLLVGGPTSI